MLCIQHIITDYICKPIYAISVFSHIVTIKPSSAQQLLKIIAEWKLLYILLCNMVFTKFSNKIHYLRSLPVQLQIHVKVVDKNPQKYIAFSLDVFPVF